MVHVLRVRVRGELYCISSMNIGGDIFDKGHH